MTHTIPPEKKEWLLKTAWKKMTLQQIAISINVDAHAIKQFYSRHDIEPMRKRDLIASRLLDLYNGSEQPLKSTKEIALILDCSEPLVKDIINDYGIDIKVRGYKSNNQTSERELKLQAIKEYEERIAKIKEQRKLFTKYT
jgi:hypothetical protein